MRLPLVIAAVVVSSALFAWQHPTPPNAFDAAGSLVVPTQGAKQADIATETRQAAALLRQPNIVSIARERTFLGSSPGPTLQSLLVNAQPEAGVVGFSVRGSDADVATRLADQLGLAVVESLGRTRPAESFGVSVVGDFEVDSDGWRATGVQNHIAQIGRVPDSRYGGGALRVLCQPSRGCGAARTIEGNFPKGRPVTMTLWVRGREPSRVVIALGATADDIVKGPPTLAGRKWQRLSLRWVPKRHESRAILAVANLGQGTSDVDIDGALLLTHGGPLSLKSERALFAKRSVVFATPSRVASVRSGSTVWWALIGAVVGLGLGLIGAFAAALARRRKSALSP